LIKNRSNAGKKKNDQIILTRIPVYIFMYLLSSHALSGLLLF